MDQCLIACAIWNAEFRKQLEIFGSTYHMSVKFKLCLSSREYQNADH